MRCDRADSVSIVDDWLAYLCVFKVEARWSLVRWFVLGMVD